MKLIIPTTFLSIISYLIAVALMILGYKMEAIFAVIGAWALYIGSTLIWSIDVIQRKTKDK